MVLRIRLRLRMPDNLLRIDGLAVNDSGNLSVGAACVKTDSASFHMSADGNGGFICLRAVLNGTVDHFKRNLVNVLHKLDVKSTFPL